MQGNSHSPSRYRWQRARGLIAVLGIATTLAAVTTSAGAATTRSRPAKSGAVNLSGVTLNVGTFLYDGWQAELAAAGLQNTPYTVNWAGLNSGFLQISAAEAGSIDLGSASFIPPIFAAGSPSSSSIKLVAQSVGNTEEQDVIVPGNSSDTSVKSLVGQTVGYVSNVTSEYFLAKALSTAGIAWTAIKSVAFQTPATGLAALENGSIQALATYGTTIATAQQTLGSKVLINGGPILSAVTGSKGLLGDAVATTAALSNPSKVAAIADLIARLDAAEGWARAHVSDWSNIVSAATNGTTTVPQEEQLFTEGEEQIPTQVGAVTRAAVTGEQKAANLLANDGLIPGAVNVGALWTKKLNTLITADEAKYFKGHPSWLPQNATKTLKSQS